MNDLPRKAHPVKHTGCEIFDQHITGFDQMLENLFAFRVFGIERNRALVVIEHGEIKTVDIRDVLQLPTRDIARAGTLDLDHIRPEPCQ